MIEYQIDLFSNFYTSRSTGRITAVIVFAKEMPQKKSQPTRQSLRRYTLSIQKSDHSMTETYINIDLSKDEKEAILEHCFFVLTEENTKNDLKNKRTTKIRFVSYDITSVIGELSYKFNRTNDEHQLCFLEELIGHMENHENRV